MTAWPKTNDLLKTLDEIDNVIVQSDKTSRDFPLLIGHAQIKATKILSQLIVLQSGGDVNQVAAAFEGVEIIKVEEKKEEEVEEVEKTEETEE
jgi:hypothetical protein